MTIVSNYSLFFDDEMLHILEEEGSFSGKDSLSVYSFLMPDLVKECQKSSTTAPTLEAPTIVGIEVSRAGGSPDGAAEEEGLRHASEVSSTATTLCSETAFGLTTAALLLGSISW